MKSYRFIAVIAIIIISFSACEQEIEPGRTYDSFAYSSLDEDGGTWKPVLLTSSSQVAVEAPADPSSQEYLDELSALKSMSSSLSGEQQKQIDYWSTNGVIRWNEIAMELVAKYFLFPKPNEDGSYSFPDPTKPDQYPQHPFSTPPYACRTYAYLGAGTFDALIAAWQYKYQYDRMAPSSYDASIATHLPVNNLPSYPSEDAVIAGFSRTMLKNLFPLEAEYLTQKAKEHEDSRLYAGINVTSDIIAGDSLGTAIANIFIGRAKTDGMKNTLGNPAVWDSIEASWSNTGSIVWSSLEIPPRPMLAPNFGHVLPWTISKDEVTTTYRLPAPPAVGTAEFQEALDEVLHYSEKATSEEQQIAFKWDDGASTYTPAGHWNAIANPYISGAQLNPLRAARIMAYMNMAIQDAGITVWDNKYFYYFPRPTNVNPDIKTIMGVPGFPAYPSGHSGFSAAAAAVLGYFFPADAAFFDQQAEEAAMSRLYGCIHYRFDCEQGVVLGKSIAQNAINIANADGAQ